MYYISEGKAKLNLMLSFAVGSLLGDVFLHLLPETFAAPDGETHIYYGKFIISRNNDWAILYRFIKFINVVVDRELLNRQISPITNACSHLSVYLTFKFCQLKLLYIQLTSYKLECTQSSVSSPVSSLRRFVSILEYNSIF